jgi:predicted MPP superfamily phosphohydrolase
LSSLPRKTTFFVFTFVLIVTVVDGLTPKINRIEMFSSNKNINDGQLSIALLSDLHIANNSESLNNIAALWKDVVAEAPDIIMLAGDYVNNGGAGDDLTLHRLAIASVLANTDGIPVVAVLGNHEQWSNSALWAQAFGEYGVVVLENQVKAMANLNLCVRGFSDAFTDQFSYLDFPEACEDSVKISLTHDPAGAFDSAVTGLVLAGHTHCGQIRLPFIGPLYVPSTAPSSAHCGLYEDDQRQVFVSSGVGTSVLPIRFLAQAQWDLITIKY